MNFSVFLMRVTNILAMPEFESKLLLLMVSSPLYVSHVFVTRVLSSLFF